MVIVPLASIAEPCIDSLNSALNPFLNITWLNAIAKLDDTQVFIATEQLANSHVYLPIVRQKQRYTFGLIGYGGPTDCLTENQLIRARNSIQNTLDETIAWGKLFPFHTTPTPKKFESVGETSVIDLRLLDSVTFATNCHQSVRTGSRYGLNRGGRIEVLNCSHLDIAYELYSEYQASINANYTLPKTVFAHLLEENDIVSIHGMMVDSELIALNVYVESYHYCCHLIHSSSERGKRLQANYALLWQKINQCIEKGMIHFDMGMSNSDNILNFKQKWGCQQKPIFDWTK